MKQSKNTTMNNFENIADIIALKEVMDAALSKSYEGLFFDTTFDALGHEITVYTREGEAVLLSNKLDTMYVINNHIGSQARIIEELTK